MPAICDWRLDEKLDVLQTPKPGDYPGSRAARGADVSKIQLCEPSQNLYTTTGAAREINLTEKKYKLRKLWIIIIFLL